MAIAIEIAYWAERARKVYRILYLSGINMKIELLTYILSVVPRACDFRDERYSKLKRSDLAVPGDCFWTPATLPGKIVALACNVIVCRYIYSYK